MSRPILAQLDLQALKDNLQIVRRAAPGTRVWSVVKANAYGHGIDRIWSALSATDGLRYSIWKRRFCCASAAGKGPSCCWKAFSTPTICRCWTNTV